MKFELLLVASLAMLPLAACTDRKAEPDAKGAASPATPATHVVTDGWLGQWNGPEGTFLRLSGGKGQ